MKNKVSPEDQALFREAMRQVKPLKGGKEKVEPEPTPPKVKLKRRLVEKEERAPAPFSDHEFLDPVDSQSRLEFAKSGFSNRLLRELRRGGQTMEAILDLHGKTVEEAREALQDFIATCCEQGLIYTMVIHGKGHGKAPPILKNKLNHWLRQSEAVLAFCSARPADGGSGALYLRLKSHSRKKE